MEKIFFEEIEENDLGEILDIYNYYVLNTTATWHFYPLDEAQMKELVFFTDKRYKAFTIRGDARICGYVSVRQYKPREAYADTAEIGIYLHKDCCGKGIGDMALAYIEQFSKENKFHVLLASISRDNMGSIRLFEKNGYEKCACLKEVGRKFGKLLDNVVFQKILD